MADIVYDEGARRLVCRLAGKMDITASMAAEAELMKKLAELKAADPNHRDISVVLDLKGVDFVASAFIRVCLTAANQVRKGSLSIVNTNPKLKQVFVISGLDSLIPIT